MKQSEDAKRRLQEGNSVFSKSADPNMLARLAEKQEPFVAILACSDSRVDPVKVFNLSLGSAFVVRTAGNCASDPSVLGSLEYATSHLGVKAIVVMGHTDCGAIKASCECCDVDNLKSVMIDMESAKSALKGLDAKDPDQIALSNVRVQISRLLYCSPVISDAVRTEKLAVHGAMFDIRTGVVKFI
ncbi:MAG: carbonic anhydrase [Thermoplasmata archaeon]|nr:carbonic anhydrase [Thermoplasmata archaeon]MCJ7562648.1 carbonic anhydrase [Thermoplasmata archaeon]TFG70964.1 MAG: carbonic anhydrase [Methanomassiliicoccus sp.]